MPTNLLFDKLRQGKPVIGLNNCYPSGGIIEAMCKGWDFVWIDCQHGSLSFDAALSAVRAAELVGVDTLLRVPSHDSGWLGVYADFAPSAVMVPVVNTADQARHIANALCFPPRGERSFGARRLVDLHGRNYHNDVEMAVVAQIETPQAAQNARAIIETDGIDGLFFGGDDMKLGLGLATDTSVLIDGPLRDAMKLTVEAAKSAGKFAGCVSFGIDLVRDAVDLGYQLIAAGGDAFYLRVGATQALKDMRELLQ